MTTTTQKKIQEFDPKECHPHPQNPRVGNPPIDDLVALIGKHSQTQPGLVRPSPSGKGVQVILGHRRVRACAHLGIKFQAVLEERTDDQALAVMVSDFRSWRGPDPFLESDAIASFLTNGWTIAQVSEHIGQPIRWCARRARLRNLAGKLRKSAERGALRELPVESLEELAALEPKSQEAALERLEWNGTNKCATRDDLERALRDQLHVLGRAPWRLDDAMLLPKAGTCVECPKTSRSTPGLFEDAVEKVESARCLDGPCWAKKLDATVLQLATQENPPVLLGGKGYVQAGLGVETPGLPEAKGKPRISRWNVDEVKEGTKGAIRCLVVSGEDKGEIVWAKAPPSGPTMADGPRGKKPSRSEEPSHDEKLEESRLKVEARRAKHELDLSRAFVEAQSCPSNLNLILLVNLFGAIPEALELAPGQYLAPDALTAEQAARGAWEAVRRALLAPRGPMAGNLENARAIVDFFERDQAAAHRGIAEAEIPDPRWWNAKATDNTKKKPKAKTHAAAVAEADAERESAREGE